MYEQLNTDSIGKIISLKDIVIVITAEDNDVMIQVCKCNKSNPLNLKKISSFKIGNVSTETETLMFRVDSDFETRFLSDTHAILSDILKQLDNRKPNFKSIIKRITELTSRMDRV